MALSAPQYRVLRIIEEHVERGRSPTIRDIQKAGGWKSVSTVHVHLWNLRAAGLIEWDDGHARTLRLTGGRMT